MKKLRFICLLVALPLGTLAQTGFVHGGYTTSMGGGESTGSRFGTTFIIGEPGASDKVANGERTTIYPGLMPGEFIILSFGLTKDSLILATIYQATGGENWADDANWFTSSPNETWKGVTVTDLRVTGLDLSANNLQNSIPAIINNLSKLDTLILGGNDLRGMPAIDGLITLDYLDVSNNRLGFNSILANLNSTASYTYVYAPQKRFGKTVNDTIQAGTDTVLVANIPGAIGYQWIFDDFGSLKDSVAVEGATTNNLLVDSITYEKMGAYRLVATNPGVPGMTIQTRNQNLWAATTVEGKVIADDAGNPLTEGQVAVYRIADGPFELSDSAQINPDGSYKIEDLVLGDFIVRTYPALADTGDVIQTYYLSTEDWVNADTLLVRSVIDNIDIQMVFKPIYVPQTNGATINGLVESDFSDIVESEEGRVLARRKVKKAGCSLRRRTRTGGGRGDQEADIFELYAYVESDDEGRFSFPKIEDGTYRINIQYPGVPMDESSEIEFTVGGDVENQVFQVDAEITEDGIKVSTDEVLSVPKPYIKDVLLYPNPTEGEVSAEYTIYRKIDDLKLEIRTINGSLIMDQEAVQYMGRYRASFDISKYRSGVYFLIFTDASGTFKHQVRVMRR